MMHTATKFFENEPSSSQEITDKMANLNQRYAVEKAKIRHEAEEKIRGQISGRIGEPLLDP